MRGNLQGLIALVDDLVELVVAQVASGAVAVEEGAVGVGVGGHAESLCVGSKRLQNSPKLNPGWCFSFTRWTCIIV